MKDVILFVDGLPASSKAKHIPLTIGNKNTHYLNFISELPNFMPQNIQIKLDHALNKISKHSKLTIVAVSFGAYIILHSNNILDKHLDRIDFIYAYSPVARLRKVKNIKTLPEYLNKRYHSEGSNLNIEDLQLLDRYYSQDKLLGSKLLNKTNIIAGANDSQIDNSFLQKYYKNFSIKIINADHIGLSKLLETESLLWM